MVDSRCFFASHGKIAIVYLQPPTEPKSMFGALAEAQSARRP
jgi:hypothetical protein